ncbi:MAG TPA: hypothetical protein V6D18_14465 [Thermosynechococcaceae cyanobacterium]
MKQPEFDESGSVNSASEPNRRTSPLEVVAVLVLVAGLLGYGAYQEIIEPILQANAKKNSPSPSPIRTASPTLPSAITPTPRSSFPSSLPPTPAATSSPLAPAPEVGSGEIYQRAPKNGVYYAQNPQLNASRREIVSNSGRFCIKLVNSPVTPQAGQLKTLVSSLSFRSDGLYVDATGEKLLFNRSNTEMTDSRGVWLWLEGKGDRAGASAECLSTSGSFVREEPN